MDLVFLFLIPCPLRAWSIMALHCFFFLLYMNCHDNGVIHSLASPQFGIQSLHSLRLVSRWAREPSLPCNLIHSWVKMRWIHAFLKCLYSKPNATEYVKSLNSNLVQMFTDITRLSTSTNGTRAISSILKTQEEIQ